MRNLSLFSTPLDFRAYRFVNKAKIKKSKTICIAPMPELSSTADRAQLGPSTVRSIFPIGAPKVRQLKTVASL